MKKILLVICLMFFVLPIFAGYSVSLNTSIDNVSNGEYSFGMGLFPLGTSFSFNKSFQMLPNYKHNAYFATSLSFRFNNNWFGDYDFNNGTPRWSLKAKDQGNYDFYSGTYFNPTANLEAFLQQYLGTNPITGDDNLVTIRLGINTRYSMATEQLGLARGEGNLIFVDGNGKKVERFNDPNTTYPWLQGDRNTLSNYFYIASYWYFNRSTGPSVSEGAYMSMTLEAGPHWFGNTLSPSGYKVSDYYKASFYLEESLSLYESRQDNGYNWVNINLLHSNSASYTGGAIIPQNKITEDRFRGYLGDSIRVRFTGPQFIAWDCYPYIELALNNSVLFGHVVNETTQKTYGIELKSGFSAVFHLRLFGFMHMQYTCGYNFISGIHASYPGWYQDAKVSFYVSL